MSSGGVGAGGLREAGSASEEMLVVCGFSGGSLGLNGGGLQRSEGLKRFIVFMFKTLYYLCV